VTAGPESEAVAPESYEYEELVQRLAGVVRRQPGELREIVSRVLAEIGVSLQDFLAGGFWVKSRYAGTACEGAALWLTADYRIVVERVSPCGLDSLVSIVEQWVDGAYTEVYRFGHFHDNWHAINDRLRVRRAWDGHEVMRRS